MKNTFVLRLNYAPIIEKLTNEQAGQLFKAIYVFALIGGLPDQITDPAVATAMQFIANDMQYDWDKYQQTCARRAESGRLGGLKTQANLRKA